MKEVCKTCTCRTYDGPCPFSCYLSVCVCMVLVCSFPNQTNCQKTTTSPTQILQRPNLISFHIRVSFLLKICLVSLVEKSLWAFAVSLKFLQWSTSCPSCQSHHARSHPKHLLRQPLMWHPPAASPCSIHRMRVINASTKRQHWLPARVRWWLTIAIGIIFFQVLCCIECYCI